MTKKTKKTATKARTVPLDKKTILRANEAANAASLRRKAADLRASLADVELYRTKLVEGMQAVLGAANTLRAALFQLEAAQAQSLALLSVTSHGIERSQRIELHPGESRRITLGPMNHEGLADIQLQNLGRALCFMTEAIHRGVAFSKGSFIRASVTAAAGDVIEVTVERP